KLRRGSFDLEDMFHAHIGGMDAFARGLRTAQKIIDDGALSDLIKERYASYRSGIGRKIMQGKATMAEMERYVIKHGEPAKRSGREEMIENIINTYV
ncbi:MAG: xylose isomerase, partial [Candidatus Latescibacterota bacterium]|nr:xylose isomerase [Candidatus Latescibacterota bacterium]